MTRREVAEKIFDYIRKKGFTPKNIQYGDGYFIFDMGDDGVVHFNIKGLHGWKFAMWLEVDENKLSQEEYKDYPSVQFFCQHKDNLDKFKPSRSYFLAKYPLEDIKLFFDDENENSWRLYKIEYILKFIKRHPFVAFAQDGTGNQFYSRSFFGYYLSEKIYIIKKSFDDWWEDFSTKLWHGSKVWFINKYKVVDYAKLIDNNGDGWESYPRYDLNIHFTDLGRGDEYQETKELQVINTWFKKKNQFYNNVHVNLSRDGIDGSYIYTDD